MSQQLADWVSARHALIVAGLDTLAAEYRLSDEDSSVDALSAAEDAAALGAKAFAAAVDGLPRDRRPAGWGEAPAIAGVLAVSRARLVRAVIRSLAAEHADESADADTDREHADDRLALAARNLAAEIGELPPRKRPEGWGDA